MQAKIVTSEDKQKILMEENYRKKTYRCLWVGIIVTFLVTACLFLLFIIEIATVKGKIDHTTNG